MGIKRFWHICLSDAVKKSNEVCQWGLLVFMTAAAGVWLFIHSAHFNTEFRRYKLECMTAFVTCNSALYCPWHVAGYTASECMYPVRRLGFLCRVAALTKVVSNKLCLKGGFA